MTRSRVLVAAVSLLLGGPPATVLLAQAAPNAPPKDASWFEKLLAREAAPLPEARLLGAAGTFKASVPAATLAAPKAFEGFEYVTLGIGASAPMECWIYDKARDEAEALRRLSDEMLRQTAERLGPIEAKAVQRIDAGVAAGTPYLALDWVYRVGSKQGAQAGQLKQAVGTKHGRSILCLHNEVGYSGSFGNVFRSLLASFEAATTEKPYYLELSLFSTGGARIGFSRSTFELDKDGDTVVRARSAMLLAADAQTLRAHDSQRIEFSRPDGSLINAITVEAENGELSENLRLDHGPEGWKVSGTLHAKEFKAALGEHRLPSDLGELLAFRRFVASAKPGARLTLPAWSADIDASQVIDTEFTVSEANGNGASGELRVGKMSVRASIDRTGSARAARFTLGAAVLDIERVHVEGAVATP